MSRKIVAVVCIVAFLIFLIVRRGRSTATTADTTSSSPIQPAPTQQAPAPAPSVPVGKSGLVARYVRVKSTKNPPHIDGVVNLDAILAYSKGVQQNFVDGRVVPTDGVYGWRNLLVVDGSIGHTAVNNEVGVAHVELDFAASTKIDNVKVVNRSDLPWKERAQNYTLIVYNDSHNEMFRQVFPADIRDEYNFNLAT